MIDWTKSMQQTFEYYEVDPHTWRDKRKITTITSSTIDRDSEKNTLGSASYNMTGMLNECYLRTYLIAIQNGFRYKIPLGTNLIQSPSDDFDGKKHNMSYDGYTSLIELTENKPPVGYYVQAGENTLDYVGRMTREQVRAPVVFGSSNHKVYSDFISNTEDDWLTFLSDLMLDANYEYNIDEMGRVLFAPVQDVASLRPVWTYTDDNSSILYPSISIDRDLYQIPNVVEVYYSHDAWNYYSIVVNDDPNSPTSTVSRGRKITHRVVNPDLVGVATQRQIDEYATNLLRKLSEIEYRVTYKHGYCPVRVGDCVRLDYSRAGLNDVKAKVVAQTIECKTGCSVSETAIYTKKLWEA